MSDTIRDIYFYYRKKVSKRTDNVSLAVYGSTNPLPRFAEKVFVTPYAKFLKTENWKAFLAASRISSFAKDNLG